MGKRTIWWEVKTLCENQCWHWAMISECNVVISKIERCHYTGMQYAFIDNFFFIIAIIFFNWNFNCKLPLKKFRFSFIPIAEFCQLQERHSHVTHLSGPTSPNMSQHFKWRSRQIISFHINHPDFLIKDLTCFIRFVILSNLVNDTSLEQVNPYCPTSWFLDDSWASLP